MIRREWSDWEKWVMGICAALLVAILTSLATMLFEEKPKSFYADAASDMITMAFDSGETLDPAWNSELKVLRIGLKVVPKSETQYVPLHRKAYIIIYDEHDNEAKRIETYAETEGDNGVPPTVISYIYTDAEISKTDWIEYFRSGRYKAKIEVKYDPSLGRGSVDIRSEEFLLNVDTIPDLNEDRGK